MTIRLYLDMYRYGNLTREKGTGELEKEGEEETHKVNGVVYPTYLREKEGHKVKFRVLCTVFSFLKVCCLGSGNEREP